MATSGWGGAWGAPAKPVTHDPDLDDDGPSPYNQPAPLYNQQPVQQPVPQATPYGGFGGAFQPSGASGRFSGPSDAAPTAYGGGGGGAGGNLAAREAALAQKEKELAEKERKLQELEKQLRESGALTKPKNWPLYLRWLRHSISEDIPDKSKRVVREIYACWWGLVWCLTWNFFCASVMLGTGVSQRVPSWFLAVIYAVTGIPLGFWLWYYRVYRAARDDSTLGFWAFLACFVVHIGFCTWAAIAVPFSAEAWSFAGWVTAFVALGEGTFPGVVYIIGACFWTIEGLYSLWCCKDAYLFFKGKGGAKQATQEAQQEAALTAFRMQQQHGGQAV